MDEQWRLGEEPPHFQDEEIIDPNVNDSDSSENDGETSQTFNNEIDYRAQCRYLKKKLKFLIYENEFFQESLQTNQRKLLKVCKDKSFLLDRLLQYEKPDGTGSETDETESSEDEKELKRKKINEPGTSNAQQGTGSGRGRKKKVLGQKRPLPVQQKPVHTVVHHPPQESGHMTLEEVERHLQNRPQPMMELLTERAPPTVPQEMFSNEPSLESEPTSPSNLVVAAEEYITLEYN